MKVGGQILWNVTPYLRNVTDLLSDGKTPMKDVLENHLKDQSFRLVHWSSITLFLRMTSQESINVERKSLPGLFLGYALYAGRRGVWKGDVLIADLEELETMDASEIYSKRLNAKEVTFHKEKGDFFPIADGRIKTPWRRSGTENTHLGTASTNSRRE